jgi:hypothetical protein
MAISDLDELVLRCRDPQARALLVESIASYRTGAYRASIVTCWLAVYFDFIEKIRELDIAGDANAAKLVEALRKMNATKDVSASLKFERDILGIVRNQFELVSEMEFEDMQRLLADRHRCAHPSVLPDDTPYAPPAELARLHIFNAVEYVLSQPPVQGKFALERVLQELHSEYFPTKEADAIEYLKASALKRPKESLLRAVLVDLLKHYLSGASFKNRLQHEVALKAIDSIHRDAYERLLNDKLSILASAVPDEKLSDLTSAIVRLPKSWEYLDAAQRSRIQNWILTMPADELLMVESYIDVPQIRSQVLARIRTATRQDIVEAGFFSPPPEVIDRMIQLYSASRSFEQANSFANEITPYVGDFSIDQAKRLVETGAGSADVRGSFGYPKLLDRFREKHGGAGLLIDGWLRDSGLQEFIEEPESAQDVDEE